MNDKFELMHGLVDGQLSQEERDRAEELLRTDPECQAELKWAQYVKDTVAEKARLQADDEPWKRSLKRFDEIDRTRRTESFVGRYAWVFCTAVLAFILAGAFVNRSLGDRTLNSAQVADLFNPVSFRQGSTGPNLQTAQMLDLSRFRVTSESGAEAAGRPCKYIRLQDQFGGLALLAMPGDVELEGIQDPTGVTGFRSGTINDANCVTWHMKGVTFVLASNRPPQELLDIAAGMIR